MNEVFEMTELLRNLASDITEGVITLDTAAATMNNAISITWIDAEKVQMLLEPFFPIYRQVEKVAG